jgi:hypothetical protein
LAVGCKGSPESDRIAVLNKAKQEAAQTGIAQKVVYTDKDGSTVTKIVQPPTPGDPTEQITTTTTPPTR